MLNHWSTRNNGREMRINLALIIFLSGYLVCVCEREREREREREVKHINTTA